MNTALRAPVAELLKPETPIPCYAHRNRFIISELHWMLVRFVRGIILEGLDGRTPSPSPHGQIGRTAKFTQLKAAQRVSYMEVANDVLVATRKNESPHKPNKYLSAKLDSGLPAICDRITAIAAKATLCHAYAHWRLTTLVFRQIY